MLGRPVRSRKKKQMKNRRRKLLRTETDETVRIAQLMKQKLRGDEDDENKRDESARARVLSRR